MDRFKESLVICRALGVKWGYSVYEVAVFFWVQCCFLHIRSVRTCKLLHLSPNCKNNVMLSLAIAIKIWRDTVVLLEQIVFLTPIDPSNPFRNWLSLKKITKSLLNWLSGLHPLPVSWAEMQKRLKKNPNIQIQSRLVWHLQAVWVEGEVNSFYKQGSNFYKQGSNYKEQKGRTSGRHISLFTCLPFKLSLSAFENPVTSISAIHKASVLLFSLLFLLPVVCLQLTSSSLLYASSISKSAYEIQNVVWEL